MRRLLLATVAAGLLLALPATASAHAVLYGSPGPLAVAPPASSRKPTNPVALAYQRATEYVGPTPCGTHVRVVVGSATQAVRDEEARYGVRGQEPLSWAEDAPRCVITFNREYWWNWTQIDDSWETFCVAMIHEFGNLAGLPETLERQETRNLRDAFLEEIVPPPTCTHYRLVYPNGHIEVKSWDPYSAEQIG